MRPTSTLALLAWLHFLLIAIAAMGWVWSAWSHTAAVGAVSDDLLHQGVIDAAALPPLIQGYPSLGLYLQQGWDAKSLGWGYALCLVALGGSLAIAITASILARRPQPRTAASPTPPSPPAPPPAPPA